MVLKKIPIDPILKGDWCRINESRGMLRASRSASYNIVCRRRSLVVHIPVKMDT